MTTRNHSHNKELGTRSARRTASAGLKAVVVQHNQGFTEGGLTPEEVHDTPDFTSSDAMVDRRRYLGTKHAPGYGGNNLADYSKN